MINGGKPFKIEDDGGILNSDGKTIAFLEEDGYDVEWVHVIKHAPVVLDRVKALVAALETWPVGTLRRLGVSEELAQAKRSIDDAEIPF